MLNFLVGLLCASAIAFFLRFLAALKNERRRAELRVPVSVTRLTSEALSESTNGQVDQAAIVETPLRDATQPAGEQYANRCTDRCTGDNEPCFLCSPPYPQEMGNQSNPASAEEVQELRILVQELQAKVARLENGTPLPASLPANDSDKAAALVSHAAVVAEPSPELKQTAASAAEKSHPAEPFAFADWTWLNGNARTKEAAFDSKFFTPEIQGGCVVHLRL